MPEGNADIQLKARAQFLRVYSPEGTPFSEQGDEDLMLAHAAGSEKAFEELVRRHQKGVLNYIYRMVQNRQVAEELTQEVFVALVRNAERYQPLAKFTTYLYAIASNVVSKEWQRRKRRPRFFSLSAWGLGKQSEPEPDPLTYVGDERADTFEDCTRAEVKEALEAALLEIPAHHREAFVLHRCQDLSYEEVAQITDSPIGTVKSRVVRAERALRPYLAAFREYI